MNEWVTDWKKSGGELIASVGCAVNQIPQEKDLVLYALVSKFLHGSYPLAVFILSSYVLRGWTVVVLLHSALRMSSRGTLLVYVR